MDNLIVRAQAIKLLISDIDGVFSDGSIYLTSTGEEFKAFNIYDGLGIKLLIKSGIDVAIITARKSPMVINRMEALGVKHIFQGQEDKRPLFEDIVKKSQLDYSQVAYIGDDLPDLPLIKRAGLGFTVPNANFFVKRHADWISKAPGGQGAVREICEFILTAQGKLQELQKAYLD